MSARAQVADPMAQDQTSPNVEQQGRQGGDVDHFPRATQPMPRILNDTVEYCSELSRDVARLRDRMGGASPHVAVLAREGEQMCSIGHIRPGIYRLRTALMLLRRGE